MLERLLLTPREAAYRLNISVRHLWSLTQPRGPIPVVRLGRRIFYRPGDLQRFVEAASRQVAEAQGAEGRTHG
jgi:S-adenosylmethionine:diacylglycerol 3-amino-3-carboxypropyl transferase